MEWLREIGCGYPMTELETFIAMLSNVHIRTRVVPDTLYTDVFITNRQGKPEPCFSFKNRNGKLAFYQILP